MAAPDRVWYARAGVWMGVGLLLLMAFLHRQVALVTILAVLAIMVGVVVLLFNIPFHEASGGKADSRAVPETDDVP